VCWNVNSAITNYLLANENVLLGLIKCNTRTQINSAYSCHSLSHLSLSSVSISWENFKKDLKFAG
jgi:hypothetical protein